MKSFLYDEINHRLVLVDEIYPTLTQFKSSHPPLTPNSNQDRIYGSRYIWENIELKLSDDTVSMDHEVFFVKGNERRKIMVLPSSDIYIILGGSYEYTEPK